MEELPKGWIAIEGGELFAVVRGVSYDKKDARNEPIEGHVPILRANNIQDGSIVLDDLIYVPRKYVSEEQILKVGDIVIATSSGSKSVVGKAASVKEGHPIMSFGAFCSVARPIDKHIADWLRLFTKSQQYRRFIESSAIGIHINNLRGSHIRSLPMVLAPFNEQHRIVEKLDRLMARSGRAREEIERIPKLVERYKQAVLEAAFSGKLTREWRSSKQGIETAHELVARIPPPEQPRGGREAADVVIPGVAALSVNNPSTDAPDGWAWVALNRIARQETGHTPSRSHPEWWGGDIPWIGIKDANAHHGGVIYETFQYTNSEGLANSAARLLPAGTVCLSRTASVGYVVIMGRDMATSQDFVTWTCTGAIEPRFLMYAIMAEGENIRRFGKGSTHTTIYFPEVRALHICLAPIEEQREIIRRVEAAFALINTIVLEVTRSTELLDRLDRQTLAKAFRGELVPQDPNDEPASVLLKRIQNARKEEINGRQKGRARRENGRSLFE